MPSPRVARILAELTADGTARGDVPHRLLSACVRGIPATAAGLVLMTNGAPTATVATSGPIAAELEELQFITGEGPGITASSTGAAVLAPDLAATGPARWPAFVVGATKAGIRAAFAFPLRVGAIRLGVLDLYRDQAGALTDDETSEALSYADAAISVVLHLQAVNGNGDPGVLHLMEDRAEVHQATGMVSVHAAVTPAQALVLLRARSYATGQPILALARDVLSGRVRLAQDGDRQHGGS